MNQSNQPQIPQQCCDHLDQVIRDTPHALAFCEKCEKAGLDMSQWKGQLQDQLDRAMKLKAEFFPNRS